MESHSRGRLSELKAITKLHELGFTVLEPQQKKPYDLVIEERDFEKVQVKSARTDDGIITAKLEKTGITSDGNKSEKYTSEEVDSFIIYSPELDKLCYCKFEDAPEWQIVFRYEEPKNNQKKGVRMIENHLLSNLR